MPPGSGVELNRRRYQLGYRPDNKSVYVRLSKLDKKNSENSSKINVSEDFKQNKFGNFVELCKIYLVTPAFAKLFNIISIFNQYYYLSAIYSGNELWEESGINRTHLAVMNFCLEIINCVTIFHQYSASD